ncbi:MAG TPA: DUF2786 domain-containing protein [Streptosporangiaceae bacterium]|nr:DUF2786 domain-containing protein [Streptosporangiaceae bacterium]
MTSEPSGTLLERVRKLLAKAEDDGVTPAEAEALTAKAAELMARYGIDRALLAATRPETDQPANRVIDVPNPWAQVRAHLLAGLVGAMRCQCVLLPAAGGKRVHVFGYTSDLERAEMLYTSLLVQMAHGLAAAEVPVTARSARAWRRSWLLGYASAVVARVRAAEERAASDAEDRRDGTGPSTALVLADRSLVVRRHCEEAYPVTRKMRITYTGSGYRTGYAEGERADIGGARLRPGSARALTR